MLDSFEFLTEKHLTTLTFGLEIFRSKTNPKLARYLSHDFFVRVPIVSLVDSKRKLKIVKETPDSKPRNQIMNQPSVPQN